MDWMEVCFSVPVAHLPAAQELIGALVPDGIYTEDYSHLEQEVWEIAHIDLIDEELLKKDRNTGIIHAYLSPQGAQQQCEQLRAQLTAAGIPFQLQTKNCRQEDWENNWKQYFKPLPVGERLLIHPLWERRQDAGDRVVLQLEPGLAFGTGTHATTQLCLRALERTVKPDCTVLDIGCGSGILAIAGILLGAKSATGVDIDAVAVRTAAENARHNGIGKEQITFLEGNLTQRVKTAADIVVANIVADVILELLVYVKAYIAPQGKLIVCGILNEREAQVQQQLTAQGFAVTHREEQEGWVCLTAVVQE